MDRHMDKNNCVGIYCFADDHSCEALKKHSMDYILEHFSVVYQQVSDWRIISYIISIVGSISCCFVLLPSLNSQVSVIGQWLNIILISYCQKSISLNSIYQLIQWFPIVYALIPISWGSWNPSYSALLYILLFCWIDTITSWLFCLFLNPLYHSNQTDWNTELIDCIYFYP